MANKISMTKIPLRNTVNSHFPSDLNVFLTFCMNIFNFTGSSVSFGALTKKKIRKIEIKLKKEMEKNGKNHKSAANIEPRMGLNTFPNVFDVSIIPKQELVFSSSSFNY